MALFILLGAVVVTAFFVVGFLFFILDKEGRNEEEQRAVPLTDLSQMIPPPKYSVTEDTYKKRTQELEEELLALAKKAKDELAQAHQTIEGLIHDNEALKIQQAALSQAQQKILELQTQLDSSTLKARSLEEEMAAVKTQMGEDLVRARAMVSELNLEKASQVDTRSQELEVLRAEQARLKQNCEDLEKTEQKLREMNTDLTQKVDALQYELVKARAQSTGLERIGFNYKNQLEDFFKRINEVQLTNEKLSGAKNSLEGIVQEVKSQNDALVNKNRLAQFELEKLEREYEDLKARVQPKN